ncbi:chromosome segregation protein SMC [Aureibacillus halotolerans]|uniref:Chromosome partition protein Smc n=1 Tax=Aureibacillus halotolerans TaxID=1508390 RepID=A0A4R6UBF7_9BACI|nr:chromosome segregation protein SMC [Aureibacillus halotolerans]TDQ42393.1 condensin subunit Smc [Aureibacillus halotolerans]
MLLKRIEIVGFKSFADKIAIDFVEGVTAVVGPNGSGKSNVTEAIRWVLGEQSAKSLRGSKMEDIIFSGSDSKRKLNMAQVTLTLDNEGRALPLDYSEVSVTRRVFRSGESEFLINQQACRLKDIIELFMDSGLGKEAFSIISQGKVDEILNSKPEDRRKIFEEAAGVLKYKTRKRQAEEKLSETEDNLHRVEDILHEIGGQLQPLEIQASIARDYLEKKEELEQIEVAVTVKDIDLVHEEWQTTGTKLEEANTNANEMKTKQEAVRLELNTRSAELEQLETTYEEARSQFFRHKQELETLEGRKKVLAERKRNANQNQDRYSKQQKELTDVVAWSKDQLARESATLKNKERAVEKLAASLKEKQSLIALNENDLAKDIETLKADYIERMNEAASAKNEYRYLQDQKTRNEERQRRLTRQNQSRIDERNQLSAKVEEAKKRDHEATERQMDEKKTLTKAQEDVSAKDANVQHVKDKLYQAYHYLREHESKINIIKQMQDGYEGFYQGVRTILQQKNGRLQGIHGAVAELLRIPAAYEVAIETALGAQQQHIVVENEGNARQAIQFLRSKKSGRATFLPLEAIQTKTLPDTTHRLLQEHEGAVGVASELIASDSVYDVVKKHLLGHIIIAKDLPAANDIAGRTGRRHRIVTLEGDVVHPGGSMSGGATTTTKSSYVSRKNELVRMQEQWTGMKENIEKAEANVQTKTEQLQIAKQALVTLEQKHIAQKDNVQECSRQLESLSLELKHANDNLAVFDQDYTNVVTELDQLQVRLAVVLKNSNDAEASVHLLNGQIMEKEKHKKAQEENLQVTNEQCTELKIQLAQEQESLHYQKEKVAGIQKEHREKSKALKDLTEELQLLSEDMSKGKLGEQELSEHIDAYKEEIKNGEAAIAQQLEEKHVLQEKVRIAKSALSSVSESISAAQQRIQSLDVKLNRLDVLLENHLAKLQEEYGLTYEKALQEYPLKLDLEDARERVKLIKRGIEELGSVNVGAIEEYERIAERHQFLQSQREDLLQAKETLYEIIGEMDSEMTNRFIHYFEDIREHFQRIFTELFGGGSADLVLTDPSHLLTSGVDIVCQPPGKKRRNLSLLSGGERALTAIALLFAILEARPVPFCVLDEVEAALDEANVFRFASFLKRFSEKTQFIVITHRKGTMEEADVLYGVTMQGSGVSKVLSVQLEEAQESVLA